MSQKIADLEIVIHDQAEDAATKVDNLADATKKLGDTSKGIKDVASGMSKVNEAASKSGADKLRAAISSVDETVKNLCNSLDEATKKIGGINSGGLSSASAEKMGDAVQETVRRVDRLSQGFLTTVRTARELSHTILPNIVHQFGRMLKMRIMRTIVKQFLAGITEGLQNVYNWASMVGNGFKSTMDSMASSALYLKNSIGAAFASLVSLVAPHIESLIDVIVEGINYVNMFFAVLGGQTTYTKAKKVAVEYGKAASGAIGGAASAAKELKETLSVLDFDELNQLADQPTPSTGGGGGGGGGTPGTDYSDMFETAKIESNWLTEKADWLKKHFNDVLRIVGAISAGILAWNISDVLSKNITALNNLSTTTKLGITLMVTGFVLEATSAYSLGKNGFNIKDIIMAGLGTAMAIGGSLVFGTTGLALSIPLSIAILVVGYSFGKLDAIAERLSQESESWKKAAWVIDKSVETIRKARESYTNVLNSWESNVDDTEDKFAQGRELLDMFKELSGKDNPDAYDLTQLQGIVDAFNNLDFGEDVKLEFEIVDGAIQSNIDKMDELLGKYEELAMAAGYTQFIQDAYTEMAALKVQRAEAQETYDIARSNYMTDLGELSAMTGVDQMQIATWMSDYISGKYNPDTANLPVYEGLTALLQNGGGFVDKFMETMHSYSADVLAYSTLNEIDNKIASVAGRIEIATNELHGIHEDTSKLANTQMSPQAVLPYLPTSYEQITGQYDQPHLGGSRADLQQQYEQLTGGGQLNIFADPSKNISYMKTYGVAVDGVTNATEGASDASSDLGKTWNFTETAGGGVINTTEIMANEFTDFGKTMRTTTDDANGATIALRGIGTGLNFGAVRKGFQVNLAPHHFTETAKGIKKTVESTLNNIGDGMKYTTIMSTINKGLSTAQASTPFTDIGVSIGSNMQSGSLSGYSESAVITSYKNGLTTEKKKTSFNPIGTSIGGNIQTGAYNGFSSNVLLNDYLEGMTNKKKKTSFTGVGGTIGGDVQSGAYNGFSSYGLLKDIKTGMEKTFDLLDFTPIGKTIAGDIKYGIKKKLSNTAIDVTTSVGGVQSTTKGTMWVNMTAANGALGLNAGTVFIAGEAGAEAVGTINGRTGVANRDQIASAIAMALQPMLSGGGTTTTNVNVNMDSASVARASLKGQRAMNKQYNIAVRS